MKKKKIIAVVLVALLIAALCGGVALAASRGEEISLKENQRYVYAYITSIQGNEVTYMEVEESVVTALTEEVDAEEDDADKATGKNDAENAGAEDTDTESSQDGGMSFPGGGEMPDMSNMPDMSSMGGFPGGDSTESASASENSESSGRGGKRGDSNRQASGTDKMQMGNFGNATTTVTTYIPVGVTVHTATDVSTTFSRLASGDLVKILVETNAAEEDVILEIWMLQ